MRIYAPVIGEPFIVAAAVSFVADVPGMIPLLDPAWIAQVSHLSLTAALFIAVVILYRSNAAKDGALLECTRNSTAALTLAAKTSEHVTEVIQASQTSQALLGKTLENLEAAINRMESRRL